MLRLLILLAFFLSGVTGLVYEIAFDRYMTLLVGGTSYAHMIVLAAFMGGLALGNWTLGSRADKSKNLLRFYGTLEVLVGVYSLTFPFLFNHYHGLYLYLIHTMGIVETPWAAVLKFFIAALLILPSTILMGGTLPILSKFLTHSLRKVGDTVGTLYFINSAGALVGTLLAGFFMVYSLGLHNTVMFTATVNILIGLAFFISFFSYIRPATGNYTHSGDIFPRSQRITAIVVIGLSGALSMLYELVWTRMLTLALGSSTYSFTIMLASFIGGITLGGLSAARLMREGKNPMAWFAYSELAVGLSLLPLLFLYERLPFVFHLVSGLLGRSSGNFIIYLLFKTLFCFILMLVPAFFIGMTLPLATRISAHSFNKLGRRIGTVFSVNTLGTVIGAILTGLLLIPWAGLFNSLAIGVFTSLVLGLVLYIAYSGLNFDRNKLIALSGLAFIAIAIVLKGGWDPNIVHAGLYRFKKIMYNDFDTFKTHRESHLKVLFARDGRDASVAVLKDKKTGVLYLKINGKTDAGTGRDVSTELWLGHLGPLLTPSARNALVVGLGSGITAGALLSHPNMQVDQVEISGAVVQAARFFRNYNENALKNPRMHLHITDAFDYIRSTDRKWSIIVSEPSNPWIAGISRLFALEFFQDVRNHLTKDGLLVQWIHLYEMDDAILSRVLNTLSRVFDHVTLWECNSGDILIVASKAPINPDFNAVAKRLGVASVKKDLDRPKSGFVVSNIMQLLGSQLLSEQRFKHYFPGDGPMNTENRLIVESMAPRAFFLGSRATLPWLLDERRVMSNRNHLLLSDYIKHNHVNINTAQSMIHYLEANSSPGDIVFMENIAGGMKALGLSQEWMRVFDDPELDTILNLRKRTIPQEATVIARTSSVFFQPHGIKRFIRFSSGMTHATPDMLRAFYMLDSTRLLHRFIHTDNDRKMILKLSDILLSLPEGVGPHKASTR